MAARGNFSPPRHAIDEAAAAVLGSFVSGRP
jgi:hypothetical protein